MTRAVTIEVNTEENTAAHVREHIPSSLTSQHPFEKLAHTAPLLITRAFVIAALQFFAKRAILAQADELLLAAYADIGAIEVLIFRLFKGLHIVSAKTAHLRTEEINAKNDLTKFNPIEIGVLYRHSVLFSGVLIFPITLLCLSATTIFRWTNQPEMVIENSASYFYYGIFAYFADMLYRSQARIMIGLSQPSSPLIADTVESVLDVILTYSLVNGKWGLPKKGVEGAAIAYAGSAVATAVGFAFYLNSRDDLKKYQLYQFKLSEFKNALCSAEFKKVLTGGLYISCKSSIVYITQIVTTFLCGISGPGALVGLQAAGAYGFLVSLPIGGFSEAASVVVGRLFKNNLSDASKIGYFALRASLLFSSICAASLFIFSDQVAKIFINRDAAHEKDFQTVKTFLRIQAMMEVVSSIGNVGADVLAGCLETRYPFLLTVAFIFALNSALTVAAHFVFHQDASTIYAVQLTGLVLSSAGMLLRWNQKNNAVNISENPRTFYKKPLVIKSESPRNVGLNELLPTINAFITH